MDKNKPVRVLWDGNIKASIFDNSGPKGPSFGASYARIYTDPKTGQTKEAYSFSGVENLRVSELGRRVHHVSNQLRAEYNTRAAGSTQPQAQASRPQRQPEQGSATEAQAYQEAPGTYPE